MGSRMNLESRHAKSWYFLDKESAWTHRRQIPGRELLSVAVWGSPAQEAEVRGEGTGREQGTPAQRKVTELAWPVGLLNSKAPHSSAQTSEGSGYELI